ncbi:MAG: phosphotransferase [Deltaproteobacteria bacterium]|nr:phosphotransferase [Deltaproteobacteria bacterium]
MNNQGENNINRQIGHFLQKEELAGRTEKITISSLSGDGSTRLFFMIKTENTSYCGVYPAHHDNKKGLAEANAAFRIGSHLRKRGIPVPEIHAFDPVSGFILFEDLGETLLYDYLQQTKENSGGYGPELVELYKEIIEILLYMQISGSVRFDRKWCWDTQRYDKKLMLEKESGYFIQAFCRDLLEIKEFPDGLNDEFKLLAGRAARQPAVYFLHRDFQSRNLMLFNNEIRVIDFQGARLGPLGYDLASLLIDPYIQLPEQIQQELLEYYLEHYCKYGLDDRAFLRGYPYLVMQRNLQILGAFAFLGFQKQKIFFRQFILPAALSLQQQLAQPEAKDFPKLRQLTDTIMDLLEQKRGYISVAAE